MTTKTVAPIGFIVDDKNKELIAKLQRDLDDNEGLQQAYDELQSSKETLVSFVKSLFPHVNLESLLKIERLPNGSFRRTDNDTYSGLTEEEMNRLHRQFMDNIGGSKQNSLEPIDDIIQMMSLNK